MGEQLERRTFGNGITMTGCFDAPVCFGFTERTGGASAAPYASLNLGTHVGDDPAAVAENRRRVLEALGAAEALPRLLVPNQVHGDHVAVVRRADEPALVAAREELAAGADAVVLTVPGVPVLLCYADCAPVVITAPGACAVVHSGWKGTFAGIAGKAARVLAHEAGCTPRELTCYLGPHIRADAYEVSVELADRFRARFGADVAHGRQLDLAFAIRAALADAGVDAAQVVDPGLSTTAMNDRFFSYRAEGGVCGRHGAVALIR